MSLREVAGRIPASLRGEAAERLTDLILNSKNAGRIPSDLAKTILYYWQRDQLVSEVGLEALIKAAVAAEPEKTAALFSEQLGLKELVAMLQA
ncbi:MAG: hypothetical protein QW057_06335 [Candidatus Bathyarchaeia archaeon]